MPPRRRLCCQVPRHLSLPTPAFFLPSIQPMCLPFPLFFIPSPKFPSSSCLLAEHSLQVPLCLNSLLFHTHPTKTQLNSSPGEWENACNEMQRMLIVRSLRQDRVAFCVTSFIVSNLGSRFIEPPVLNMKLVSGLVSLPAPPLGPSCLPLPIPVYHMHFLYLSPTHVTWPSA